MTNITSQHLQTNPFLCRSCRIAGIVHARRLLVRQGRHSISSAQAQDTHQWHHSKSKPAIPHVDARFRKHRHKKRISGIAANSKSKPSTHSSGKHSISQAQAKETHQWHRSKQQIKTSSSPCKRSISQAPLQETHQPHRIKRQIKTSRSPCSRSILRAPSKHPAIQKKRFSM